MRHLLTGFEFSQDEYLAILDQAAAMKKDPGAFADTLKGKAAAIMFEKPSLRTRTTFEIALFRLGAHGVYLDLQGGDLGKRESIGDYARNLSRWTDCLVGRVFSQHTLEELAATGSVPVINALSDLYHPAQAMADYLTVREHLGTLKGVSLAYVGDGNNVANSLLVAGAALGVNVSCFCPLGHGPDIQIFNKANDVAKKNGCRLEVIADPSKIQGFDAIYTGYLASAEQVADVCAFFDTFKTADNLIVVDPVMADNGKLYPAFGPEFPAEMAKVCAKADLIVPNLTEAAGVG